MTNSIESNAEQPNTETENVQDNPSTVSNVSEITTPSDNTISEITTNESNVDSNSPFIENTLIISETRGKVILPYKLDKLNEILNTNTDKYDSIKDVIDKLYTIPISYYQFSPIARFKEAFKLIKEKEKGSKVKALALAFELFVNYNLHPAIITACNSLDELDIYLACLEENNLNDFHFFNIIYEIPLATYKPKHSL